MVKTLILRGFYYSLFYTVGQRMKQRQRVFSPSYIMAFLISVHIVLYRHMKLKHYLGTKTLKIISILNIHISEKASIYVGFHRLKLFDNISSNTIFYIVSQVGYVEQEAPSLFEDSAGKDRAMVSRPPRQSARMRPPMASVRCLAMVSPSPVAWRPDSTV